MTSRFVWTGCSSDVNTWCRECQECAHAKIQPQERSAVEAIPVPLHKFSHVHVDLVGLWLRTAEDHTHLLRVVDRTTRWAEAIPDSFMVNWVARFGVPATITTDQGTQFTGATWQCMCNALGSSHVQTKAYHPQPQSNSMMERFHRQMKTVLRSRCSGAAWLEHLPWVLLGLCVVPKVEAGVSAAEATYGHSLVLPSHLQPRHRLLQPR